MHREREVAFQKQKQYVEASLTKPCDLNPVFSMYNWKNIHQKMGAIQATSRTAQMSGGGEASLKEIEDGVRRAALFS